MTAVVDNIRQSLYESLKTYFESLSMFGYKSYTDINMLLSVMYIEEFVNSCVQKHITPDDYKTIDNALYCLFGKNCLFNFPQNFNIVSMNTNKPSVCFNY